MCEREIFVNLNKLLCEQRKKVTFDFMNGGKEIYRSEGTWIE